jgi:Domain of unknown function (DUF4386)
MMRRVRELSPSVQARAAGALYLLVLITGLFAQGYVSGRLVVWNDAAATAANILEHPAFFELGFTVYMVEMTCQIALTVLMYQLLKPVNRSASLLATCLALTGCTVKIVSRLFYIAPLFILGGSAHLKAFGPEQLQALGLLLLRVNDLGAGMALSFFGFAALLRGFLISRSTFLPRVLGGLAMAAGLGLLTFLSPTLGRQLFAYTATVGLIATLALMLWLLVFGVDDEQWWESARTAAAP